MYIVSGELKGKRNIVILVVAKIMKDYLRLIEDNDRLREEAGQSFNDAKEALVDVVKTSKGWALKRLK